MDIRFYLSLFLRRLHYVVILTVLGAAAGITLAMILPPRYVAEATLVVESEQIPDDLAASTVRTAAVEQLGIIRQRILARSNLLDLAEEFNIYRASADEPNSPDEIVSDMRSRVRIDTEGGGRRSQQATTVTVSFAAERADLSAQIANEIVTMILQENVEMRTTVSGQTLEFFEREVERLDQELAERSAQVVAFQEENRDALPNSLEFRRNRLIAEQERLLEIDRELTQLNERRENLFAMYERTGRVSAPAETDLSPEARELRRLRESYASSSAVMSETNPRLRVLRAQIDALEAQMAEQSGEVDEAGEGQSAYDVQLADIDNQSEFLRERRGIVEEGIAELRETIAATPNNEVRLRALQRALENTQGQYDRAVENRARAETGDMIEALSKGQRISVIENATAPSSPNSPDRKKVAMAGTAAGLLAGLGVFALLELATRAVRRGKEIEDALNITPIATLSYIRTRREVARRRMLIASAFLVVAVGVPAGLWAIDTYYQPVSLLLERVADKLPDLQTLTERF